MEKVEGMDEPVKEAFVTVARLASAIGVKSINQYPDCWEVQVDERWWISVNGHREERQDSHGTAVPPFHAAVEYNGWPAGLIGPYAGILAAGECANEDAFIAALQGRIAKCGAEATRT